MHPTVVLKATQAAETSGTGLAMGYVVLGVTAPFVASMATESFRSGAKMYSGKADAGDKRMFWSSVVGMSVGLGLALWSARKIYKSETGASAQRAAKPAAGQGIPVRLHTPEPSPYGARDDWVR